MQEKILIDWSYVLNEVDNFHVELSQHGQSRTKFRDNIIDIPQDEIKTTVEKCADEIISNWGQHQTFVIHNVKNKLNIIGGLLRRGTMWIFKVITVMIKPHFYPKPGDKFILVSEYNSYQIYKYDTKNTINMNIQTYVDIINEKITNSDIPYDTVFDFKNQIYLPSNIRKNVTNELSKIGDYFDNMSEAVKIIFKILNDNDLIALQEDYTPFEGFFTGSEGRTTLFLGYNNKVVKNSTLVLSWYRMGSKYEVIKYIS